MGAEEQGTESPVPVAEVALEDLRAYRLQQEREWYLSEEGFLDFVRDCGAAPDAQQKPHGEGAHHILNWTTYPDPEAPDRDLFIYKMVLWPRGSFKSSVFDIGYACWMIAKNPSIRLLVCSETAKQAKTFVEKTKEIIDSEWFREHFGIHRGKRWAQGQFYSALSTKNNAEPTLQATGVGEVRTGMHWDGVIMDDVCSQENTRTPEAIESLWYWFGETLAQLDPGCWLLVIGTLHHFADIYCRVKKDPEMRRLFEFSIHAWSDPVIDPRSDEPADLFFPGRLTRAYVVSQKAFLPPRLYACFYENRPTTEEEQLFRPEYFRVIEDDDVPQSVWTYLFTDFAFIAEEKKKGKADRTAFWVVALDCNRTAYVLDFYVGRWKPSDSVRIACDLWNRYQRFNMKGVVIEDTTHKELLSSIFEEVRRHTFVRPKIIPIPGRSQEIKDIRIEAAEPRFRRGDIYFARSLKEHHRKWKPLFEEMTEWPFSAHDDIPDAISDVDKQDKDGKFCCPSPPAGWRTAPVQQYQPSLIDGRFNPDYGYPARENIKRNQHGGGQADLWRSTASEGHEGPMFPSQSIWKRPQQPPRRLGGS